MGTAKRKGVAVVCPIIALALGMLIGARSASAVPILQLYIEGAEYDDSTDTWVYEPPGSSSGAPFVLWTIGNVDGPGGAGTIHDVKLSVLYDLGLDLTITLTPTTASNTPQFSDFPDSTTPGAPVLNTPTPVAVTSNKDASLPKLSDGKILPTHGEYIVGRQWIEFGLGDFDGTDEAIADFTTGGFPDDIDDAAGQINAYLVTVTSPTQPTHGVSLHFDLYDSVQSGNKGKTNAVFAPFSHDADAGVTIVPTPAATVLGGIGFAMLGLMRPRRRSDRNPVDRLG